jgi:hypothetical protein
VEYPRPRPSQQSHQGRRHPGVDGGDRVDQKEWCEAGEQVSYPAAFHGIGMSFLASGQGRRVLCQVWCDGNMVVLAQRGSQGGEFASAAAGQCARPPRQPTTTGEPGQVRPQTFPFSAVPESFCRECTGRVRVMSGLTCNTGGSRKMGHLFQLIISPDSIYPF